MNYAGNDEELHGRNRALAATVGLSPIWVAVVTYLLAPRGFGGGLHSEAEARAALVGQMIVFALVGLLALAGTVTMWRARSRTVLAGAVILLTVPALVLLIFSPAFVLLLRNLGS